MSLLRKISLVVALMLALAPTSVFSEIYLKPGDSGEFTFTVLNAADSVEALSTPQVVYNNRPVWFNLDNVSMVAYDSLKQGTSCQITMDFIDTPAPAD